MFTNELEEFTEQDPLMLAICKVTANEPLTEEEKIVYNDFVASRPPIKIDWAKIKRMKDSKDKIEESWLDLKRRCQERGLEFTNQITDVDGQQ